jgi:hypothetical protein
VKRHGAYQRPGALDPWEHNRIVARRKKYRRLALEFRAAGRSTSKAAASFRSLGEAAQRAAESLRKVGDVWRETHR